MLVYDIEILNAIPNPKEPIIEGITYCKGWGDHENMGITVIGVYDYADDRYRVFCKDNFAGFLDLLAAHSCVVGFNSIGFDNKVILAECKKQKSEIVSSNLEKYFQVASYDILAEIVKITGSRWGFGLDAMCEANFGTKKTGNGAMAPVDWQRGNIGAVIDYCLNDVKLTKQLLDRIILEGFLTSPKGGSINAVKRPSLA